MSWDQSYLDQHLGDSTPPSSSSSPKQTSQEKHAQAWAGDGHMHLLRRWFSGPQPGVSSSLPYFSHRSTFGLINGVNFLMMVGKCPFDFFPWAIGESEYP